LHPNGILQLNHEEEKRKKQLAKEQQKKINTERFRERLSANRASMALPCPRVVELYAVRAPLERREVNAFFKAFC
jgi:hypothetical protein